VDLSGSAPSVNTIKQSFGVCKKLNKISTIFNFYFCVAGKSDNHQSVLLSKIVFLLIPYSCWAHQMY
jgi:hypothetical protein